MTHELKNNRSIVVWAWYKDEHGDVYECTGSDTIPWAWEVYTCDAESEIHDEKDFPTLEAALREALKRCDETGYSLKTIFHGHGWLQ